LSQLIALRYGSVPIVHDVGGLSDTIGDFDVVTRSGNGFVFDIIMNSVFGGDC
jgi:starch synthase